MAGEKGRKDRAMEDKHHDFQSSELLRDFNWDDKHDV